jgi:hypothetical protein
LDAPGQHAACSDLADDTLQKASAAIKPTVAKAKNVVTNNDASARPSLKCMKCILGSIGWRAPIGVQFRLDRHRHFIRVDVGRQHKVSRAWLVYRIRRRTAAPPASSRRRTMRWAALIAAVIGDAVNERSI